MRLALVFLQVLSRVSPVVLGDPQGYPQQVKKTTSGRPDGKSFCKPPRHINIGLWQIILPNQPST
jgi:hypothetical protein